MSGVNKAIILGRLGADPETKYMPNGNAVTNISVATSESWTDKQSGAKQERTEWHRITFFGRLAEVASEYLQKGSEVYVEGKIQTEKWQDKDGHDRYTTKIIAQSMNLIGGRQGGSGSGSQGQQQQGFRDRPQQQQAQQEPAQSAFQEDDIPF